MQLTVKTDRITRMEFEEKTQAVRSCRDAKNLGEDLDAQIKRNRFVPYWDLPETLKDHLGEVPTGHATQVFTEDPSLLRVLVICHRL